MPAVLAINTAGCFLNPADPRFNHSGLTSVTWTAPVVSTLLLYPLTNYVVATHAIVNAAGEYLVGPTALYPGTSTPARRGETIVLYGIGFTEIFGARRSQTAIS
jgi:hypothetical protein